MPKGTTEQAQNNLYSDIPYRKKVFLPAGVVAKAYTVCPTS